MKIVTLLPGREKLALNRHPWVFSGAISRVEGQPAAGELVTVRTAEGKFVATGQFNPGSKIRLRLMEWNEGVTIDDLWYRTRLEEAWALRQPVLVTTDALRVFFSESDGIPGLVADLFGPFLVLQFLTSGADREKALITGLFQQNIPNLRGILEKSDGDGRRMEGLPEVTGVLWGQTSGEIAITENGARFLVDPTAQKTGFYTDQRDNRVAVSPYFKGRTVLDAFTFTGGFAVHALRAGAASVSLLDSSADALAQAAKNLAANGYSAQEVFEGDAFQLLRDLKKQGRTFGAIVLDPPKLATAREHLEKAMRGYKDLNLQALKLLESGGYLASFSCSGLVSFGAFREMIAFAAKDSGRRVDVVRQLHQAPCHPIRTSMPEAEYLKGVLLRVL
ncbi:MAG: class I SAM-dependent rRNA methyltransferase [Spirochaetales bacterium]